MAIKFFVWAYFEFIIRSWMHLSIYRRNLVWNTNTGYKYVLLYHIDFYDFMLC